MPAAIKSYIDAIGKLYLDYLVEILNGQYWWCYQNTTSTLSLVCVELKDSSGLQLTKFLGAKAHSASSIHSLEKINIIIYFYLLLIYSDFYINIFT